MSRSSSRSSLVVLACAAAAVAAPLAAAAAQQGQLSVSPFMAILPTGDNNASAGLGLTLGGPRSGFALRGSGVLALKNSNTAFINTGDRYRPWGLDADALFYVFSGGRSGRPAPAPYLLAGIGTASTDTLGFTERHSNWSYGAGLDLPFGSAVSAFGESRWRMSRFVLPTADHAPSPRMEVRFGLSFHVGGSSAEPGSRGRWGRERRR